MKKSLGIYVHVPFCIRKCRYCDFCSVVGKGGDYLMSYADRVCEKMNEYLPSTGEYRVDTVYFGGGTPSLMPVEGLEKIMRAVSGFDLLESAEITLECNPATADREYFERIRAMGINRLSIGLQSGNDRELVLLGRAHDRDDFLRCLEDARAAGFDNISADLMYGIPDQTEKSFAESLNFLAGLGVEHISAYGLTVEEGTYFYKHRNELDIADDDTQAQMYCLMGDILSRWGYDRYEISNFAKEGRESRHNMRYWKCLDYLGFGPAAHSCFGGRRFGNSRDIEAFMRGEDIVEESYEIDGEEQRREYIMLGMRLSEGLDTEEYRERFGRELWTEHPAVKKYISEGFMSSDGERVFFTEKGFLVSNIILAELIEL